MNGKLSVKEMVYGGIFLILMCLSGGLIKMVAPFLPFSLQPTVALAAGLFLLPRTAFACQVAYTVLGLMGLPVFTSGGGFAYVLNPSFGYIIGFTFCSTFVSFLYHRKPRNDFFVIWILLLGLLIIYGVGIPYMVFIIRYYVGNTEFSLLAAFTGNIVYFLKDLIIMPVIILAINKLKKIQKI